MSDAKIQKIVDAIGDLDPTDSAHFTENGTPSANVLKEKIGAPVSAAERDAAWKLFQEMAAAQAEAESKSLDLTGAASVVTMINGKPQKAWYRSGKRIHIGDAPAK